MRQMKTVLSIAGSDPSGGAGLQADLKVFQQAEVYGIGLISLHTVQNTKGVKAVEPVSAELLDMQLATLLEDLRPDAIKTGALANAEQIEVLAKHLDKSLLVIDPVFSSTNGASFLDARSQEALVEKLLPDSFLVTPNLLEAEIL